METLKQIAWHNFRAAHEARLAPLVAPRLTRMSHGNRHPVDDFLFEYYSYRPGQLLRWHPGHGVGLEGGEEYLAIKEYRAIGGVVSADASTIKPSRRDGLVWIHDMLKRTSERPPFFGCAGLHEWAMVYRAPEVRHPSWPLRFSQEDLARIVESLPVCCSHYDAFRFFTLPATVLNRLQPTRKTAADFEQSGCLHANMDLYKWSYKLAPFSSSELVADAFELAREIRLVDMQASPYDFLALGLEPMRVETPEGRNEYEQAQREFSRRGAPIRSRLIALCECLLDQTSPQMAVLSPNSSIAAALA